jgi:predicted alpha/beta-fold hydrolase
MREPYGTVLFALPDLPAFISQSAFRTVSFLPRFAPFYYRYPRKFSRRIFHPESGMRVESVIARGGGSGDVFILVHGIFQSKNFKFIRDMATQLSRKFAVVVVDTRDHLGTFYLSPDYPASGGTMEGKDILGIARALKREQRQLRVFLVGFSYGGGIVLNAVDNEEAKDLIAGVVAVSPTMMIEHAVSHIDTDPGFASPFYPMYSLFQTCLRLRHGVSIKTFKEYLHGAAVRYGATEHDMMDASSLSSFMGRIKVPTYILIARNDPVIPDGDIETISRLSSANEYVHICVRESGGHIAFAFIDQGWFYRTLEEFAKTCPSG